MSTQGSLTDCSLTEIFQFIEKGKKTGLLRLFASSQDRAATMPTYYIWVHKARIVALTNRSDQQGLVSLIAQDQGVNTRLVAEIAQSCPLGQPLGLYFKTRLILEGKQLQQLFNIQVLQQVCPLFQIQEGQFAFDQNVRIPTREMTGLGIPLVALNHYCSIDFCSKVPIANG